MNALIDNVIARFRTTLTLMLVMVGAGVVSYLSLPRESDPDIPIPFVYVSIPYPGISPEDSERLLVRPMERELRSLEGLKEITSVAAQNHAGIALEFDVSFDKDKVLSDVRNKADIARAELPEDAEEPVVTEFNTATFPAIFVVISGDVPSRTLYGYADRLKNLIEAIPSVLEVDVDGKREDLLEVVINPTQLETHDLDMGQVLGIVGRNNQLVPAGALESDRGRFAVKVPGLIETRDDLLDLTIATTEEGTVRLRDIAEIRRTYKRASTLARFNGRPAVILQARKRLGANIIEMTGTIRHLVDEATKDKPSSIHIDYSLDESVWIFRALDWLQSSILAAVVLVMIVVVGALGLRSGSLVGFAIPSSFMIAFLILSLMGMTINMMVMFGMVFCVGLLVDAAIVIVEYADRKMAEGFPKGEAYALAAKRMFWPIASSTATTLAAFLPLLLWPGVSGRFMSYLPMMVILVLSASFIVALFFLPTIGARMGKTVADKRERDQLSSLAGTGGDIRALSGITGRYVRFLDKLLRRPLLVLAAMFTILVSIFFFYSNFNNGVLFSVDGEVDRATVTVRARGNLSLEDMRDLVDEVERIVLSTDGVINVVNRIGPPATRGSGRGRSQPPADQIASIFFELAPYETRRASDVILNEIRRRAALIPGIHTEIAKEASGPPTGKDIQIELRGTGRAALTKATKTIRAHLDTVPGIIDIEDTLPLPGVEWALEIDRERVGYYNVDVVTVGTVVQLVTTGVLMGTYSPDDAEEEVDIRLRFPQDGRVLDQLDALRIPTPQGPLPVSNFVTRVPAARVDTLERVDALPRMRILMRTDINPKTGKKILADDKMKEIKAWMEKQDFPRAGIFWRFRGANEEQEESGAFLRNAMVGALFLMFIILVTQFNSFYHAFLTLSTVILSVFGVMLGMLITGQAFSILMTGTGIIALAGIVVNNSIVLIDTYHRLSLEFSDKFEAILRTAGQRFRPILLTTITTICGLLPMATQLNINLFTREIALGGVMAAWWYQMATAIISGLAFATMITLILIPVMLAAPQVAREFIGRHFGSVGSLKERRPAEPQPAE